MHVYRDIGVYNGGMYLKVKATPNARTELFEKRANGTYAVSVKERAQKNRANVRVLELLSEHLHIPLKKLRMKMGHRGRNKTIEVLE